MPSPLIPSKTALLLHLSKPFVVPQFMRISSSSASKPSWNSNSKLLITHPVLSIMESCNSMTQLKQIQAHMTRTGLMTHRFPASRVLAFCALSDRGNISHARLVFDQIQERNVFIWNTMIRGYARAKCPGSGFSMFRHMVRENIDMDHRTYIFSLKICELFPDVSVGSGVHCLIFKLGFDFNRLVRNGLMHFYAKNGLLRCARHLFDESSADDDVVSWTTMIDGYAQKNLPDEAWKLFCSMISMNVVPNEVTMISVLSACSKMGIFTLGRSIHRYMERINVRISINLLNALLDMYVKCGSLNAAKEVFDKMGVRDVFTWTTMINGYAKFGDLTGARWLFEVMPERNVVSWNAMIAGYSQTDQPQEAVAMFSHMEAAGFQPTEGTLVSVLSACSQLGCLDLGKWIYKYYIEGKRVEFTVILGNALIDMYAKCGNIDKALSLFYEMPKRDLVSWNSMIAACAVHGSGQKALVLFEEMKCEGLLPDDITFVGVLSACSHSGLTVEGRENFKNMKRLYGIEPKVEHYACMIDLLGRVGQLREAYELICKMPMEPDEAGWGALLNACKIHGNLELSQLAGNKLMQLSPNDSGIYMLMSHIYATRNEWEGVKTVRSAMRNKGLKKTPGCSSINVGGEFHNFLVADQSHSQSEEIYAVLDYLYLELKLEGYVPKRSHFISDCEGIDESSRTENME